VEGQGVRNLWKYMLFLALAVPAVYAYAASQGEIAKPRWLDHISVAINRSLAAQPQAEISSVDPIAAAKVDEDLDYRIAERTKSPEGWRAFLTAHPDGPHAQSARAELDQLAPLTTASAPTDAQSPDTGAADTTIPSGSGVSSPLPSTEPDAATVASDEICRGDEDRLQQLSNSPTSDGVIRLLIELRCEKLRPQLLLLAKRLDTAPAAPAGAAQDASSDPPPAEVAPKRAAAQAAKSRTESRHRARPDAASRASEPRRRADHDKAASLPPFFPALFGAQPRNQSSRQARSGAHGSLPTSSDGGASATSGGGGDR
jgi:hypothetical protein